MRLPLLLVAALAATLLAAVPASADDASVKRAWDSEDPAFAQLGRQVRSEQARWQRRGFTRDGRLLQLMRRGERLSGVVVARLQAEQPSSPTGTEARTWATRAVQTLARYFAAERRFVRAMRPGGSARARRLEREVRRLDRLGHRQADRGRALFRQLGLA